MSGVAHGTALAEEEAVSAFDPGRFPHRSGRDCATATMRNLLAFYGPDLSETMVFGLGRGLSFWFCEHPESPFPVLIGQNLAVEEEVCTALGITLVVHHPASAEEAEAAIDRARSGVPTVVKADPYYLEYCWRGEVGPRQHFGEHILLLAHADAEHAWVSDIWDDALLRVPLDQLRAARLAREGYRFLLPEGRWYELRLPPTLRPVEDAVGQALSDTAERLLAARGRFGISGIRGTGSALAQWAESASPDVFRLGARIIAQRMDEGTSGSCFRALFHDFLLEAADLLGSAPLRAMGGWFGEQVVPPWQRATRAFKEIAEMDERGGRAELRSVGRLFEEIADREEEACRRLISICATL
jgi:hypothetical protein